ncbi:response regulator transcription factor [Paenibacillus harenae]|uniref:response regulator transcription factor n=1 Tax=Paenibacillus harenae TaxID=306543 RepID=UPI00278F5685|nr:response regulator [Paenibacillus harenae]MDQ0062843.1 two-component system response regulator YesN [Paenibacillus harenae]
MLLKALIVDDEPTHIQGLERYIKWKELGFDAPYTAESGQEALEIMRNEPIDVLISDVSMPVMTGIELVAKSKAIHSQLQVLMISGYNEFEFVQEAMNVGAQAYVLKPIKVEEVESKLTGFRKTLTKLKQIEDQAQELQQKVNGSLDIVRERFVADVIGEAGVNLEMLHSWDGLLELPSMPREIGIIVFGYDQFHTSGQDARERVVIGTGFLKAVHVGLSDYEHIFVAKTGADEIVALHINLTPMERASIEKQLAFIQNVMQEQYGSTVTIGNSRLCSAWEEVPLLYKEVKFMMARSRLMEGGQILHYDRLEESDFQQFRLREEVIPEIIGLTEAESDVRKVVDYVNNVFDMLLSQPAMLFTYMQAFGMALLSELARKQKWNKELGGEMNLQMWQKLIDCRSEAQIRDVVLDYIQRYKVIETKGEANQRHNLIGKVTAYLEAHFQEHITVKQIAEIHHLNASYLSVLFKKEMGKTISDFLQETRMNKAKELLRDPSIKVYEVSEQVGFQTSAYFAYLFKKTTGYSPQEYRDYH